MSYSLNVLKKNELSLEEFCSQLSISVATGKNWIKLGKIKARNRDNIIYFKQNYLNELKEEISNGKNKALKSRRNKKYVSGNLLYKSYIGDDSINLNAVEKILQIIEDNNIAISNDLIDCIINECAIQIILKKYFNVTKTKNSFYDFLKNQTDIKEFNNLFHANNEDRIKYLKIINENKEIFDIEFFYEENKDIMGLLYISLISIGDRKATGTYYTPERIVRKLNDNLFDEIEFDDKIILDPCCGTGNFLLNLPNNISFDQIYATDIDAKSIRITRLNLAIKYNICNIDELSKHIKIENFLESDNSEKFDIVLGNPPWGYAYDKKTKEEMCKKYYSAYGNNVESFDLFIERASKILNEGGYISFVLPESLLNVKSHTRIRELILKSFDIKYIEYLGNAFDKVQCPSIIIKIKKTNRLLNLINTKVVLKNKSFTINAKRELAADCFALTMDDLEYGIIKKINTISNKVYLKNNSLFALGIVTGNNAKYLSSVKEKNSEIILRGKDIFKYTYNKNAEYISFTPEKFQQVAPTELYRSAEKLFYRFISNKLVFAYDDNKTLSLNSCNILIPTFKDINIKYILAVLNSRVAQYYFDNNFNSIKILRGHIENIPIPKIELKEQKIVENLVDKLIKEKDDNEIQSLYEEIDDKIAKAYNMSQNEMNYIKKTYFGQEMFLIK